METLKFGFSETYESFFVFFAVVPAGKKYSLPVLGTGGLSVIRAVTAAFFLFGFVQNYSENIAVRLFKLIFYHLDKLEACGAFFNDDRRRTGGFCRDCRIDNRTLLCVGLLLYSKFPLFRLMERVLGDLLLTPLFILRVLRSRQHGKRRQAQLLFHIIR